MGQLNPSLLGGYAADLPTAFNQMYGDATAGGVDSAVKASVAVAESGDGVIHQTKFTLTAMPLTLGDTAQGGGIKIYTFPKGRIKQQGAAASLAMTTTSPLASTLNTGVTCNYGVGSTTQANGTLATTEQDFVQTTNITASATINVAGAAAKGTGLSVTTSLDGTGTAIAAFLNVGVAGATDIDGDATVTITGTITLTWINLGS